MGLANISFPTFSSIMSDFLLCSLFVCLLDAWPLVPRVQCTQYTIASVFVSLKFLQYFIQLSCNSEITPIIWSIYPINHNLLTNKIWNVAYPDMCLYTPYPTWLCQIYVPIHSPTLTHTDWYVPIHTLPYLIVSDICAYTLPYSDSHCLICGSTLPHPASPCLICAYTYPYLASGCLICAYAHSYPTSSCLI